LKINMRSKSHNISELISLSLKQTTQRSLFQDT
jgi:hypothetical protein